MRLIGVLVASALFCAALQFTLQSANAQNAATQNAPSSTDSTPATRPALTPSDPTVSTGELRQYMEKLSKKDKPAVNAVPKSLEIVLTALVVSSHGESAAMLTVSGLGSFTVTSGTIIPVSNDVPGSEIKIVRISAAGVEALLPHTKDPIMIK